MSPAQANVYAYSPANDRKLLYCPVRPVNLREASLAGKP